MFYFQPILNASFSYVVIFTVIDQYAIELDLFWFVFCFDSSSTGRFFCVFKVFVPAASRVDVENGAQVTSGKGKSTADVSTTKRRFRKSRPVRVLLQRLFVMVLILAVLAGLASIFWYFFGWQFLIQLVIVVLVAYLAAGHWRWFYVALVTAPRDLR